MIRRIYLALATAVTLLFSGLASAGIPWTDSYVYNDQVYLLYAPASRIDVYDLKTELWLPSINFQGSATGFAVDASGIYIAESAQIYRLSPDGLTQTWLVNLAQPIQQLMLSGTHIYALEYNEMWAINKSTLSSQYKSFSYSIQKAVYSSVNNKIFARNTGVSPADIMVIVVNGDGSLGNMTDSPYHGDYPGAAKVWVSANHSQVVDSSGTIYSPTLTWLGGLGGTIDNMLPLSDGRMVTVNGKVLTLLGTNYGIEKVANLQNTPIANYLYGNATFSFSPGIDDTPIIEKISLDQFQDRPKATTVNPLAISYIPDATVLGADNVIYLLHKASKNIFRWSVDQQAYLDSIPLYGDAYRIAYSAGLNKLFVLYSNGEINTINPTTLSETFLYRLADTPCGLTATDQYIMACDNSGAWVAHYIISPSGAKLAYKDWNYASTEYIWDSVKSRIYFFRDDTSPNDLHWEQILSDGTLGLAGESPYHGSPLSPIHPIRVSPSGTAILLGSGQLLDSTTLNIVFTLPEQISAATWINGNLWTTKKLVSGAQIDHWTSLYSRQLTQTLYGKTLELLSTGDRAIIVLQRNNNTAIFVMSPEGDIDADGILDFDDLTPIGVDIDNDQIGDYKDNCSGVANPDQLDTDFDGLGNSCDPDDDNDGINDQLDLCPLNPLCTADTDGDGIDNIIDTDDDNDTVPDLNDNCPLIQNLNQANLDADLLGNACDSDDDGDGVADTLDAFPLDASETIDLDGDGIGNNADTDDDNDTIPDAADNCQNQTNTTQLNNDADGQGDVCDLDDDNDGYLDINDMFPMNAAEHSDQDNDGIGDNQDNCLNTSNFNQLNTDSDGQGNACDIDDDNDGIADVQDAFPLNASESLDSDADGLGNNTDQDDDNDGVLDSNDQFPLNRAASVDNDGDTIPDVWLAACDLACQTTSGLKLDNCPLVSNTNQLDTDLDNAGDTCDTDDDNDGIADNIDAFPLDSRISLDTDTDTYPDSWNAGCNTLCQTSSGIKLDNCILISNADQANIDSDSLGDACDNDNDNDGTPDINDAFPLNAMASTDTDNDGMPDTLRQTDNFESATLTYLPWATSTENPWYIDNLKMHNGAYSVRAGAIGHFKSTILQINVNTGSSVSFWLSTSTEGGYDFLRFYIDDVVIAQWSGTLNWQQYTKTLTPGNHRFKWVYSKDGSISAGQDTAWIDDVTFSSSLIEDVDDDNDGTNDINDVFPLNASESSDQDSDTVGDNTDNCIALANTNQLDTDADHIGNACDSDDDGDGFSDIAELSAGSDPLIATSIPVNQIYSLDGTYHGATMTSHVSGH